MIFQNKPPLNSLNRLTWNQIRTAWHHWAPCTQPQDWCTWAKHPISVPVVSPLGIVLQLSHWSENRFPSSSLHPSQSEGILLCLHVTWYTHGSIRYLHGALDAFVSLSVDGNKLLEDMYSQCLAHGDSQCLCRKHECVQPSPAPSISSIKSSSLRRIW